MRKPTNPHISGPGSYADPQLRAETFEVANRLRSTRLLQRETRRWQFAIVVSIAWFILSLLLVSLPQLIAVGILAIIAYVLFLNWKDTRSTPIDFVAAARKIEENEPSLKQALSTAIEQPGDETQLSFLQSRLVNEILNHPSINDWRAAGADEYRKSKIWQLAFALPLGLILIAAFTLEPTAKERFNLAPDTPIALTVKPGDAETERGSTVVVTAHFKGDALPKNVDLVALYPDGRETREPMGQSLSDPVFVYSLHGLSSDVRYQIDYDGRSSESYDITLYDLPALSQSDATLNFPDYTRIPARNIEDTRRVSAVEGTEVIYSFSTNKPVEIAKLVDRDEREMILKAANPERTRFETKLTVTESLRWDLHLQDDKGRENPFPPEIRIEALPNKRPELAIAFPRGDQRVSPIEEIELEAKASDDFGLIDYGIAYSVGSEPPVYLTHEDIEDDELNKEFASDLSLEESGVQVDDLISWYAWADDYGPDGQVRRSTSDLFFAEVRSLDEIFRENEGGGGMQGGMGNQGEELIDLQRQIAIALFKLMQRGATDSSFLEDTAVINDSQMEARQQVEELKGQLEDENARSAANLASSLMDKVTQNLDTVLDSATDGPLEPAWSNAQGAVQALLRMQPKEFNVSRSRQAGGGGGGQSRSQRQLDQLDFSDEENRYETASQAQSMTSPEQKEQLQVLSKLSELARRQEDINKRLQELQTEIAKAKDEEEKERIRRELKRLEEEQRRMLADIDETRERMDRLQSNSENREARERLDQTRQEMQELGESLRRGEVSQALATGTRAQENLEELKEDFRNETSSQFTEQLREARRAARELAENQRTIRENLESLDQNQGPRLDNSEDRDRIVQQFQEQQENLDTLMQQLREVTEASEFSERKLHRELYDLLRQQSQSDIDEQLQTSSDLLRQGFVEQTENRQPNLQRGFDKLQESVERAASSVLGDEATSLRFAQEELDSLTRDLQAERGDNESGSPSGQQGEEQKPGLAQEPSEEGQSGQGLASDGNREGEQQGQSQSSGGTQPGEQPGQEQSLADAGNQPGQQPGQSQSPQPGQQPGSQPGGSQGSESPSGQPGQSGGQSGGESSNPSLAQQPSDSQSSQPGQPSGGSQSGGSSSPSGGQQGGFGGGGSEDIASALDEFLREFSSSPGRDSPLTGGGFGDWNQRLRTIEELVEQPDIRQRLSQAREEAERLRAEFKRHGAMPQWGVVNEGIIAPLSEARSWVAQELARHEDPQALQPIDRDPVPRAYQESVRKYYESLGQ